MFARDVPHPLPSRPSSSTKGSPPSPPWQSTTSTSSNDDAVSSLPATPSALTSGDEVNDTGESDSATSSQESAQEEIAATTFVTDVSLDSLTMVLSTISFTSISSYQSSFSIPMTSTASWETPYDASMPSNHNPSYSGQPQSWYTWGGGGSLSTPTPAGTDTTTTEATPLPDGKPTGNNRHKFNGGILAGILVPIVVLLLLGLGLLLFLRRRRRIRSVPFEPITEPKEQFSTKKVSSDVPAVEVHGATPPQPHLIMSPMNHTYFTGLDTMSIISAEPSNHARASEEPPPPYWPRSETISRSVSVRSAVSSIRPPQHATFSHQRPVSPLEEHEAERSPFEDAPIAVSRPRSSGSITSTLYSSNASLVEARPARRSVGGAHFVGQDERSPFADPDGDTDDDVDDRGRG